jgi:long-chain acyl-CoA synthetase
MGHTADVKNLVADLQQFQPTFILSVPRVFEKVYNTAQQRAQADGKGAIFKRAEDIAIGYSQALDRGGPGLALRAQHALFNRLVYGKLRDALGGHCVSAISGGAPLGERLAHFFRGIGLDVREGYGLTETAPVVAANFDGAVRIGTVGRPLPGTTVRIADDGEILIRGPGLMKEYFKNPAATAEMLRDGWLYTGDIGTLDRDGYLKITDRKKDIIVTAGGKNVAPQNLENELKTDALISQVMVHGDKRKFLSALVTLDEEAARKWAAGAGVTLAGPLHEDPRVRARVQQAVDALNAKQASYSTIKKFAILPHDLTQEAGELTPTLKVKRKYCTQKYQAILDAFYAE